MIKLTCIVNQLNFGIFYIDSVNIISKNVKDKVVKVIELTYKNNVVFRIISNYAVLADDYQFESKFKCQILSLDI